MIVGIVDYPCANCLDDAINISRLAYQTQPIIIDYRLSCLENIDELDILILPGGFSFADDVRPGYIASQQPVRKIIMQAAELNKKIIGICNGFQILLELGLLPGKLVNNVHKVFIGKEVSLSLEMRGNVYDFAFPLASSYGRYINSDEANIGPIRLQYKEGYNFNGSDNDIAGVSNKNGNIIGFMPHPDRVYNSVINSDSGISFMKAIGYYK